MKRKKNVLTTNDSSYMASAMGKKSGPSGLQASLSMALLFKKKKKDRKERKRIKIQITLFRNLREGNAASMQMQESTT